MSAAPALNEYEQQRANRIAENMARMKALNLRFMASEIVAAPRPAAAPRRARAPAVALEARRSARQVGCSAPGFVEADDEDYDEEGGEEGAPRRAWSLKQHGRRAYIPQGPSAWDGQREFVLPPLLDDQGREVQRNKSCHICTQCLASWRGNFTRPLACSACPRIYCSRCLFHINGAETVDEAEAFIQEHQGNGWLCFTCTGTCACQEYRNCPKIEAHKRRGWVGVTGGGLAPCDRRPRLSKRATRGDAAQVTQAAAPQSEEGAGAAASGDDVAPASPSMPSAPRLELPTPERADPPTEPAPASPVIEDAPAAAPRAASKRKRAAKAAAPAGPGAEGEAIVGRRVEAFWDAYDTYFPGVLESFDAASGEHCIRYDDGEFEVVTLPDKSVRYLLAA